VNRRAEFSQIVAAGGIFLVGALVYLFDRSGADIYFIPEWWTLANGTPTLFGALGQSLPSFAHTFCFILLTSALLTPWQIPPLKICLAWCGTEALLESGQADPFAARIVDMLPAWLADWPILQNVPGYFSRGAFDLADLAAIGLGGVVAWCTIVLTNSIGVND